MQAINYIIKAIGENYISVVITMIFTPFALYLWKWLNGAEAEVKQHRIKFILGSAILGGCLMAFVIGSTSEMKKVNSNSPDMKCEIGMLAVSPISGPGGETNTGVIVFGRISNAGIASTAWNWKMKVKLISGIEIQSGQMMSQVNSRNNLTPFDKFLPSMLAENGLGDGSARLGWIEFIFAPSLLSEMNRPGVEYTLEFEDASGKLISTSAIYGLNGITNAP